MRDLKLKIYNLIERIEHIEKRKYYNIPFVSEELKKWEKNQVSDSTIMTKLMKYIELQRS